MTALTPEECVTVVNGIEEYLVNFLHASDFLTMCRRGDFNPDQFDIMIDEYSKDFQLGYMFEYAIDSGLLIKMLKPGLGRMIANEAENLGEPDVSWPADNPKSA